MTTSVRRVVSTVASIGSPTLLPWLWTGLLALLSQVILIKLVSPAALDVRVFGWLLFASHLLLLPFLFRNAAYIGIRITLAGLFLNLLAMGANGGMMPVPANGVDAVGRQESFDLTPGQSLSGTKNVYSTNPRLGQLSDAIVVSLPGARTHVVSVGDVLIFFGTILALASVSMRLIWPTNNKSALRPVGAQ